MDSLSQNLTYAVSNITTVSEFVIVTDTRTVSNMEWDLQKQGGGSTNCTFDLVSSGHELVFLRLGS